MKSTDYIYNLRSQFLGTINLHISSYNCITLFSRTDSIMFKIHVSTFDFVFSISFQLQILLNSSELCVCTAPPPPPIQRIKVTPIFCLAFLLLFFFFIWGVTSDLTSLKRRVKTIMTNNIFLVYFMHFYYRKNLHYFLPF